MRRDTKFTVYYPEQSKETTFTTAYEFDMPKYDSKPLESTFTYLQKPFIYFKRPLPKWLKEKLIRRRLKKASKYMSYLTSNGHLIKASLSIHEAVEFVLDSGALVRAKQVDYKLRYKTITVDYQELGKGIINYLRSHLHQMESLLSGEVDRIMVGPDVAGLIKSELARDPVAFTYRATLLSSDSNDLMVLEGVSVQIVPWLEGVMVVPKLQGK